MFAKILTALAEDLSGRLMDGAHQSVEGQMRASVAQWSRFRKYDASSKQAYETSVPENRQQRRQIIGAVDPRLSVPRTHTWRLAHSGEME